MPGTAVTIGNFDGVHAGHIALVRRARHLADEGGRGKVVALAFDPHPISVLRPDAAPARLSTFKDRVALLTAAGCDEVVQLQPTMDLLNKSPEQFMSSVVQQHHPRFVVEGDDFRFGKGRAGDVQTLATLGAKMGFRADVVPPVEVPLSDHLIVRASSSIIRWLLTQGRVADAARVLGRPYELSGTVVKGDQRGRDLGFPTTNLDTDCLIPADGIYAAIAHLPSGGSVAAAVNIGNRPTFNGQDRRAEAHLMPVTPGTELPAIPDYNWPLRLHFIAWLRDDLRFDTVELLVDQIRRDCDRVQRVLTLHAAN
jgi:riboflavin kinase/FMN adenylyltransferase